MCSVTSVAHNYGGQGLLTVSNNIYLLEKQVACVLLLHSIRHRLRIAYSAPKKNLIACGEEREKGFKSLNLCVCAWSLFFLRFHCVNSMECMICLFIL